MAPHPNCTTYTYEDDCKWEIFRTSGHEAEDREITSLVARFQVILCDVRLYRRMLGLQSSDAQSLLDAIQWVLDTQKVDFGFRRRLIVATQRISAKSGLYPTCYHLENVVRESQHPLTAGGFADIYKGDYEGSKVCLKAIRIYASTKIEHYLKQFSKEMILWGQLCHPNVLPIYGLYRLQAQICLVSPWMDQGDVNTYLKSRPEAARLQLVIDVARGLLYLHKNKIIHGDLKGPNVLVNDVGRACLADFGISSVSDPNILAWTTHSSVASKGGSVRWQAPELIDIDNDEVVNNTEASDVYAWACVCYEIFTSDIPFASLQLDATVVLRVKSGAQPTRPPDSSRSWRHWGLTEDIWLLMQHCWSADPVQRPKIEEVIQRLASLITIGYSAIPNDDPISPSYFRKRMVKPSDATIATLQSTLDDLVDLTRDMIDTDEQELGNLDGYLLQPELKVEIERDELKMNEFIERGPCLERGDASEVNFIASLDHNEQPRPRERAIHGHGTPLVSSRNPFRQLQKPFLAPFRTMSGSFWSIGGNQNTYTGSVINSNSGNTTTNIVSNSNNDSSLHISRSLYGRGRRTY